MIYLNNIIFELIENFLCDNANSLKCKKNEVIDKMINEINKNKLICIIKIYIFIKTKTFNIYLIPLTYVYCQVRTVKKNYIYSH